MKSHHIGSEKHFLKILLGHSELKESIKKALGGGDPHYPLHLTLTTIHLVSDQPELFSHLAKSISKWKPLLPEVLTIDDLHMEVMGASHIKFLSLCFLAKNLDQSFLIEDLCDHVALDMGMEKRLVEVNGRSECELFLEAEKPLLHIPLGEKKTHIALLSTNDMKNHNTKLYKSYLKDSSVLTNLIDTSLFIEKPFTLGSISFT